ncbi:MAG: hypothetical protein RJB38_1474 [Pseudomonadota bacterium]|jgi:hypothetical protein
MAWIMGVLGIFWGVEAFSQALRELPPQVLPASTELAIRLSLPSGFKLNLEAPNRVFLKKAGQIPIIRQWETAELRSGQFIVRHALRSGDSWVFEATLYLCEKANAQICVRDRFSQVVRAGAQETLRSSIEWTLRLPENMR